MAPSTASPQSPRCLCLHKAKSSAITLPCKTPPSSTPPPLYRPTRTLDSPSTQLAAAPQAQVLNWWDIEGPELKAMLASYLFLRTSQPASRRFGPFRGSWCTQTLGKKRCSKVASLEMTRKHFQLFLPPNLAYRQSRPWSCSRERSRKLHQVNLA